MNNVIIMYYRKNLFKDRQLKMCFSSVKCQKKYTIHNYIISYQMEQCFQNAYSFQLTPNTDIYIMSHDPYLIGSWYKHRLKNINIFFLQESYYDSKISFLKLNIIMKNCIGIHGGTEVHIVHIEQLGQIYLSSFDYC